MHYRYSHCDYRQMDIWGRTPIIRRPYQSTLLVGGPNGNAIYFQGAGEQAHNFRDLGSPAQK